MRFTESKKRTPWLVLLIILVVGIVLVLTVCRFDPTPQTVQKTIVFEAD